MTYPSRPSYREEARLDRAERARLDMERDAARVNLRMAEKRAAADFKREQAQAKAEAKIQRRAARTARFEALTSWVNRHVTDLLLAPVIVVPGVLSWSAMASYGASIYGPLGVALPAFSEAGAWSFAAATTLTRHRKPDAPVWALRVGTAVFAGVGAGLNFAHGFSTGGPVVGAVMAIVSVAGIVAHQLVTAGPRRSRAERQEAKFERAASRRERRARRAALRSTTAHMDSQGRARLVYRPGPASLKRHFGRTRLVPVTPERREIRAIMAAPVTTPATTPDATVQAGGNTGGGSSAGDRLAALESAVDRLVTVLSTDLPTTPEDAPEPPATVHDNSPEWVDTPAPVTTIPEVAQTAEDAALAGLKASLATGKPYTVNGLQKRYRLTRTEAVKLRQIVIPKANGHAVLAGTSDDN